MKHQTFSVLALFTLLVSSWSSAQEMCGDTPPAIEPETRADLKAEANTLLHLLEDHRAASLIARKRMEIYAEYETRFRKYDLNFAHALCVGLMDHPQLKADEKLARWGEVQQLFKRPAVEPYSFTDEDVLCDATEDYAPVRLCGTWGRVSETGSAEAEMQLGDWREPAGPLGISKLRFIELTYRGTEMIILHGEMERPDGEIVPVAMSLSRDESLRETEQRHLIFSVYHPPWYLPNRPPNQRRVSYLGYYDPTSEALMIEKKVLSENQDELASSLSEMAEFGRE